MYGTWHKDDDAQEFGDCDAIFVDIVMMILMVIMVSFLVHIWSGNMAISMTQCAPQAIVADFNNYLYFGTVARSMVSLFSVVLLAEWSVRGSSNIFACFFMPI